MKDQQRAKSSLMAALAIQQNPVLRGLFVRIVSASKTRFLMLKRKMLQPASLEPWVVGACRQVYAMVKHAVKTTFASVASREHPGALANPITPVKVVSNAKTVCALVAQAKPAALVIAMAAVMSEIAAKSTPTALPFVNLVWGMINPAAFVIVTLIAVLCCAPTSAARSLLPKPNQRSAPNAILRAREMCVNEMVLSRPAIPNIDFSRGVRLAWFATRVAVLGRHRLAS